MKAGRPQQTGPDDLDLVWGYTERQRNGNGSEAEAPPLPSDPSPAEKPRPDRTEDWLLRLLAAAMVAGVLIGFTAFYTAVMGPS